jgi:hypothetical protein
MLTQSPVTGSQPLLLSAFYSPHPVHKRILETALHFQKILTCIISPTATVTIISCQDYGSNLSVMSSRDPTIILNIQLE